MKILDKYNNVLLDINNDSLRGSDLSDANLCGANLRGSDLSDANLRGSDLSGANLCGANLCGSDLYGANLYGANLRDADLYGANLYGANLRGSDLSFTKINWDSHDLIAEILRREAEEDIEKLRVPGLIMMLRNKCWDYFLKLEHPQKKWAIEVLKKYNCDKIPQNYA